MSERYVGDGEGTGISAAFVTGASRGIGAETAKALGHRGWAVGIGYREKIKRAQQVASDVKSATDPAKVDIFQADIVDPWQRSSLESRVGHWIPKLDALVLNAAGGLEKDKEADYAMKINREAQVDLAQKFMRTINPNGPMVYVTSHWAHLHGEVDLPPFEYDPIASSKYAGEQALRTLIPELSEREIRLVVVTGGLVTGTFVGDYAVRSYPEWVEGQRTIGNVISVEEMGARVAAAVADPDLPSGHTEWVGAGEETFLNYSRLAA